ncbi:MAG: cysteine desulfurase [Bacteroidetes bacterium]|nr:cysteine desulfurase [Candidatus Colenecus caballi]
MDVENIRRDFPILSRTVYGKPLVYLDNAATTQKPRCVIDSISDAYCNVNANVHRGIHFLSQQATDMMEAAREKVRAFIGAESTQEVIFTRGTTESFNLLASSFSQTFLKKSDEIIISGMEHHSNIVPWQMQAERIGFSIKVIPVLDNGELDMDALKGMISDRTRLISVTHVSNVLGTVNPVREIIGLAHSHGIPVAVDGAQSVPHMKIDVHDMDADFYAFSGHKIYGPTGIGVLYGRRELLEQMPPYQGGGEMIKRVTFERTTYNELPFKFEAGTPDYVGSIALARALDYVGGIGLDNIADYEHTLCDYAVERLSSIPGMRFIGRSASRSGVVSFLVGDIHPSDMGTLLDRLGIAVRTGHHCAEPLMQRFGIPGTVRASFSFYNTKTEIDSLADGVQRIINMF